MTTATHSTPSFELSEELKLLRDATRDFCDQEIAPGAAERDAKQAFPGEIVKRLGQMQFLGMLVPEEFGGSAAGNLALSIVLEEVNRADASVGVTMSVHNSLLCSPVVRFGTEDLKQRYLPRLATGELLGAYALTEPQAGSDSANLRLKA